MTNLTIPTADWSGDLVDISINEATHTVRLKGDLLRIKTSKQRLSDHNVMELCEVYFKDMQLCTGYKDGEYWFLDAGDVSREDSNLYIAAAQMYCNLV